MVAEAAIQQDSELKARWVARGRDGESNGIESKGIQTSRAPATIQVSVESVRQETDRIRVLRLERSDGGVLPRAEPGAHIDLHLRQDLVRQYSLTGDLSDPGCFTIAVLRETGGSGGSEHVHERVRPGDRLAVSPPRNNFPLITSAENTLLIAGGIGITPLMPMAYRLHEMGRAFSLEYCTRGREHTAFRETLQKSGFADRIHWYHRANSSCDSGLNVRQLLEAAPRGTHVYCCGPESLIEAVLSSGRDTGLVVHIERFKAAPQQPSGQELETFDIQLARSGKTLSVKSDESILDVLFRNGQEVPCSCEQGLCRTCLVEVLEGIPDHRDAVLSAEERASNRIIAVCVSRALSPRLKLNL
jgi:ferredoxin-NADP reductase